MRQRVTTKNANVIMTFGSKDEGWDYGGMEWQKVALKRKKKGKVELVVILAALQSLMVKTS